jgi:hypothetical protein
MTNETTRQDAMELRTQYLDNEKNGRTKLETLHRAIRDKDREIDLLDAELRKSNSNLAFAKKMALQTTEASQRSERDHKAQELKLYILYMDAIKTIERLKKEVLVLSCAATNAWLNFASGVSHNFMQSEWCWSVAWVRYTFRSHA